MSRNIKYENDEIRNYFKDNRVKWSQLYPSERKIFDYISPNKNTSILDIGCGCGGLGMILRDKFNISDYTGIEINSKAASQALILNSEANIVNKDFISINFNKKKFDLVISLSCIDWNIEFEKMLKKAWELVNSGGEMVLSLRLTKEEELLNISDSYQYINYEGEKKGEIAPYIVLNYNSFISKLMNFESIKSVYGFGYFGKPSKTAVTKYNEICFAVFAIKKLNQFEKNGNIDINLDLPL